VGSVCAAAIRVAMVTLVIVLGFAHHAHADNVDSLIKQLQDDDSEKVRFGAAINLTKLGDARAILPMVKALGNDSDKNVRGACANGLGKLINDKTKSSLKGLVVSALKKAAADDESDFVKQQAASSLTALGAGSAGTPNNPTNNGTNPGGGGLYVNVGPMSSKTGTPDDAKFQATMAKVSTKTLAKEPDMPTTWPGGVPTKAALAKKGTQGFYVDGTLNEVKTKTVGAASTISCKVSMLLASFPDKSVFGFLSGGASVQASSSAKDQALATDDCISAVVEDLIKKKIVPTIRTKAGP
jgi:hypothetical protein